ncbi:hypothetical protein U27_02337 [Candidatus Vecturithrix granuli]|uniref:HEPN domain-containing protein n=1 Tax=Vecturithrix granuli TaxID=1499967 RepID=A0A0S6WAD4_VECG1|nr:hypothetical protein U27_02337 [Candidatus Vecturithrix granuli]
MKAEIRTLIAYRLERANEALAEANLLLECGFANTAVSRLYYSCFYAVSALLLAKGFSSAKHSGIRSLFHQHFVKTGVIKANSGRLYDRFFDNRQRGDYQDLVRFDPNDVLAWHIEAKQFVETIETLVQEELKRPE